MIPCSTACSTGMAAPGAPVRAFAARAPQVETRPSAGRAKEAAMVEAAKVEQAVELDFAQFDWY